MNAFKCWSAFCLVFILSNSYLAQADTGIDGSATSSSSFTMTGPVFISSLTVINKMMVPNGVNSTDAAAFGQIKYLSAPVMTDITVGSSTVSNAFISSNLQASITPSSTSSRVKITATGLGSIGAANGVNEDVTLFRGSTNLATSTNADFIEIRSATAQATRGMIALTFIDSPATTSSTQYIVKFKNDDGTTTALFGGTSDQVMILEEIR